MPLPLTKEVSDYLRNLDQHPDLAVRSFAHVVAGGLATLAATASREERIMLAKWLCQGTAHHVRPGAEG
jgi:uncharacterized membrane protein